jgi:hypothetical protein
MALARPAGSTALARPKKPRRHRRPPCGRSRRGSHHDCPGAGVARRPEDPRDPGSHERGARRRGQAAHRHPIGYGADRGGACWPRNSRRFRRMADFPERAPWTLLLTSSSELERALRRLKPHERTKPLARRHEAALPFARPGVRPLRQLVLDTTVYIDQMQRRFPDELDDLLRLRRYTEGPVSPKTISTRRFCGSRTPSAVAMRGWRSPNHCTSSAPSGTPRPTRARATFCARCAESASL